jgi:hypothetical protein
MTDAIVKVSRKGCRSQRFHVNTLGVTDTYASNLSWNDTFNGVKNPQWKEQVKLHINATTSANGSRTTVEEIPGRAFSRTHLVSVQNGWSSPPSEIKIYGSLSFPTVYALDSGKMSETLAVASGRFYSKCSDAVFRNNIAESAAEYKQTVKAVQHRGTQLFRTFPRYVDQLVKGLSRFKRVPIKHRKTSITKFVSDTYLEYNLGWRPAISDIGKIIDELASTERLLNVDEITASAVSDPASAFELTETVSESALTVTCKKVGKAFSSVRYVGAVVLERNVGVGKLQGNFGLTLENFVPTLYQLLPYSFVLDYFSNLGQVVNSICFLNSRLGWVCQTKRNESEVITSSVSASFTQTPPAGTVLIKEALELSPYTSRVRSVSFVRAGVGAPPVPDLVFHLPNRTNQWVTIGALLGGRLQKWTSLISSFL